MIQKHGTHDCIKHYTQKVMLANRKWHHYQDVPVWKAMIVETTRRSHPLKYWVFHHLLWPFAQYAVLFDDWGRSCWSLSGLGLGQLSNYTLPYRVTQGGPSEIQRKRTTVWHAMFIKIDMLTHAWHFKLWATRSLWKIIWYFSPHMI